MIDRKELVRTYKLSFYQNLTSLCFQDRKYEGQWLRLSISNKLSPFFPFKAGLLSSFGPNKPYAHEREKERDVDTCQRLETR